MILDPNTIVDAAQRIGIKPEELPAAEDVKKVERRLASAAKRLPRVAGRGRGKRRD